MKSFYSLKAFTLLCVAVTACNALALPPHPKSRGELVKRGEAEYDCWYCLGDAITCCCPCESGSCGCCDKVTPGVATTHILEPPPYQQIVHGVPDVNVQEVIKEGNVVPPSSSQSKSVESKSIPYERPYVHAGAH